MIIKMAELPLGTLSKHLVTAVIAVIPMALLEHGLIGFWAASVATNIIMRIEIKEESKS